MPRKQAIRRRMHSGIVDSSKNCAGRDFKRDTSTAGRTRARTHKSSLMTTRCPICADSRPNSASQRNDAKCQQPTATVALHKVRTVSPLYHSPSAKLSLGESRSASPSGYQGVCEKSKAFSRLFAAASRLPRGAKSQRVSMNFKIEVVSYVVLSTKRRLA